LFDYVREEKHFQHGKHDEEFYENNRPEGLAECHFTETVIVEVEHAIKETLFFHNVFVYMVGVGTKKDAPFL